MLSYSTTRHSFGRVADGVILKTAADNTQSLCHLKKKEQPLVLPFPTGIVFKNWWRFGNISWCIFFSEPATYLIRMPVGFTVKSDDCLTIWLDGVNLKLSLIWPYFLKSSSKLRLWDNIAWWCRFKISRLLDHFKKPGVILKPIAYYTMFPDGIIFKNASVLTILPDCASLKTAADFTILYHCVILKSAVCWRHFNNAACLSLMPGDVIIKK